MTNNSSAVDLSTIGGGTAIVLTYFGLIPGVIPTLALTALALGVVLLPVLVLALAAAVVLGPPYGIWRLATGGRRRRERRRAQGPSAPADDLAELNQLAVEARIDGMIKCEA